MNIQGSSSGSRLEPRPGGLNYPNSYMEAVEEGRSSIRISFPLYRGDWKSFEKNCLAEAHVAGVNKAITVAMKAYKKRWQWPFAPDPRQEIIYLSEEEDEVDVDQLKTESCEMKTRAKSAQKAVKTKSRCVRWQGIGVGTGYSARISVFLGSRKLFEGCVLL